MVNKQQFTTETEPLSFNYVSTYQGYNVVLRLHYLELFNFILYVLLRETIMSVTYR